MTLILYVMLQDDEFHPMAAKIRIRMSSFGHLSFFRRKVKKNGYFPEEQSTPHFSPDLFCFIWFYLLSVFPLG